jgi:DNA-binding transcriptional ArsR family regulator
MPPVTLFAALADPSRCRVLELLRERARPVHELAAEFDISRPAISRHLRVLKQAGLVREEKRGRENVYILDAGQLLAADRWLEGIRAAPRPEKRLRLVPQPHATVDLFSFAG